MLLGTQQLHAFPGPKYDGVFGLWYGKGPGVDRSGDAFRCANMRAPTGMGGVLAVAGDDHGAHSSTYPHQTEQVFEGVMMPVLNPSSVQDIVDFGLAGYALSRYCGLWVALKTIAETAEQAATIVIPAQRGFAVPDHPVPPHGFNIDHTLRYPADRAELERRVVMERLPAALAWARANRLDRLVFGTPDAPIGLVTVGRAHPDTLHALRALGLEGHPQLALYKVGMTWPLETEGLRDFARGKRALLVIEEKRSFVEAQLRDALYHLPSDQRPEVAGKTLPGGAALLSPLLELSPESVGAALGAFLRPRGLNLPDTPATPMIDRPAGLLRRIPCVLLRLPAQHLDQAARGQRRPGRHRLPLHGDWIDRDATRTFTQMGGEGATWIGPGAVHRDAAHVRQSRRRHLLPFRPARASARRSRPASNITYKMLYNDAVAMTGGQPVEGQLHGAADHARRSPPKA